MEISQIFRNVSWIFKTFQLHFKQKFSVRTSITIIKIIPRKTNRRSQIDTAIPQQQSKIESGNRREKIDSNTTHSRRQIGTPTFITDRKYFGSNNTRFVFATRVLSFQNTCSSWNIRIGLRFDVGPVFDARVVRISKQSVSEIVAGYDLLCSCFTKTPE